MSFLNIDVILCKDDRGTNFIFTKLTDHGAEESKRHDLALKKLQRARDEWSKVQD